MDEVKRTSSVDDYYARFCQSIELMISQGVTAFGTLWILTRFVKTELSLQRTKLAKSINMTLF